MKTISIDALLDQVSDSSSRAALNAGWELGRGLAGQAGNPRLQKEIERAAQEIGQAMGIDSAIIYAAALLAWALGQ